MRHRRCDGYARAGAAREAAARVDPLVCFVVQSVHKCSLRGLSGSSDIYFVVVFECIDRRRVIQHVCVEIACVSNRRNVLRRRKEQFTRFVGILLDVGCVVVPCVGGTLFFDIDVIAVILVAHDQPHKPIINRRNNNRARLQMSQSIVAHQTFPSATCVP